MTLKVIYKHEFIHYGLVGVVTFDGAIYFTAIFLNISNLPLYKTVGGCKLIRVVGQFPHQRTKTYK